MKVLIKKQRGFPSGSVVKKKKNQPASAGNRLDL